MKTDLFSLRMRSCLSGHHLSGGERLVPAECLELAGIELLRRGLEHSRGKADGLRLAIDLVPADTVQEVRLPDVSTWLIDDVESCRQAAAVMLEGAGVELSVARSAIAALAEGASPVGGSMRGAMLVDVHTGQRLEADQARGVRASCMDLAESLRNDFRSQLKNFGLDNCHVREALVLAAKVMNAPGIVAELCWSDDPDYTAGYVASPTLGYIRFPMLKALHDTRGGRAFFVDLQQTDLATLIEYLEQAPVLVTELGRCSQPRPWSDHV